MATTKDEKDTWNESSNGAAANEEWGTEVESESQIVLETEGDGFIATYTEMEPPNRNGITQAHFENIYTLGGDYLGASMFLNAGRDLGRKLKSVPNGRQVRIQWTSSIDTGQNTPMRVYKVQWR